VDRLSYERLLEWFGDEAGQAAKSLHIQDTMLPYNHEARRLIAKPAPVGAGREGGGVEV
jgi:hypothetical protein